MARGIGGFRRCASQVAAIGTPAMVFDATTPVFGVLWATAYDACIDGHMTLRAAILSALAVVNEQDSAELDRISLRRWLIESAMYPAAMLPGGPVTWAAVDDRHARAVVRMGTVQSSLIATFAEDGRLLQFDAEEDGDLSTPDHGSGEQFQRSDYRPVQGMPIPHRFRVARAAAGQVHPFWQGEVTAVRFGSAGQRGAAAMIQLQVNGHREAVENDRAEESLVVVLHERAAVHRLPWRTGDAAAGLGLNRGGVAQRPKRA